MSGWWFRPSAIDATIFTKPTASMKFLNLNFLTRNLPCFFQPFGIFSDIFYIEHLNKELICVNQPFSIYHCLHHVQSCFACVQYFYFYWLALLTIMGNYTLPLFPKIRFFI